MTKRNKKNRFNFLTKRFSKKMQQKLVMLFMAIILAFIVLIGRITYINASKGSRYTKIVLDQQEYDSRVIPYKRGDIVDRNGTKMAASERVYNVILDVAALKSDKDYEEPTIKVLGDVFGIKEEDVKKVIEEAPDSRYQILAKGVAYDKAQKFKEIEDDTENHPNVKGIWLEDDYKRHYPYDTLASDVIGFVSSEDQGAIGIESAYNDILSGTDGREYGYFDDASLAKRTVKPAKNGNTVVSTIDVTLQSIVEQCIREFNEEHAGEVRAGEPGSKNTAVIIMNPNTGEILTEASYPNFNLNSPRDLSGVYSKEQTAAMSDDEKLDAMNTLWRNFAVSDAYEPGSTVKPFTVAAGLESGALTGDESYVCNGFLHVGDWDISCHLKTGHGTQTIEQAVANSCNVALMQMAKSIGIENFVKYQHIFGFGEYTGIDLPGEAGTSSLVYTNENMGITDLAINSFGQGFNVTMTQMAAAFSSLVNGGLYYEPHVVKQIQDQSGSVVETKNPVLLRKTVSAETSTMVKQYMKAVMTSGTGKGAQVPGYDIGAKTGTAEKLPRNQGKYLLSFIGYAPQENPEVVVYVVIDEPNVERQDNSAYVLGLSQKIMSQVFPYLNITTTESGDTAPENTDPADTASQGTDYEAFDSEYEDTYTNQAGSYVDENYTPDLDDWAAGQPSE
ncbi:MAG TPA: peptidoglycan glycosyltransferase [Lachnospiraceae bacterium]|jgi:stage V sporulation protein D (sporulation-specific penicillin-binding protein)|uniref:Stage V sporulation protein D (Sporulation-specific penicillin-binding protein) n=5 Tax=Muricomes intestini TaxID=1796634 RepID=A0A4R3KC30_9FIRM|nr:penicillin-binding protein 2 [Muricomes intestini]TCS80766.1 stage V sporulation protein D (sporulation-specific penicillin-binding protein) [Muricomes intestini]HAX53529.1 peptidoglycan glycosyltransferase [Lachnospiraceae bacterium]HCR83376.1 peptidoglycan glycosyltransferase [Lachnospiraceae bacterium]